MPIRKRPGFALLAVMCCLIAVSFLVVNWLKTASFERDRLRAAERRLQADWLVEAAIERAAANLAKNENYSGETWKIAAADLGGADAAAVEIKVSSKSKRAEERTIRVSADFPVEPLHRVRSTKEIVVDIALVKQKHSG
jgi:type II secretory pathway component PulK